MMDAAEFDRFAEAYTAVHARNIEVSGEDPDYFAEYKIREVARRWAPSGLPQPSRILDFGAGIGNSLPYLRSHFPGAELVGLDVSERSLQIADARFPGLARLVRDDGAGGAVAGERFDLIFTACVFHHIPHGEHLQLFRMLRSRLSLDGVLVVFEHNPINPVTRHIVATCPFDENAVLIGANALRRTQRQAGFARIDVRYTGFFPATLAALRPLEPWLARVPLGAQYYSWARA